MPPVTGKPDPGLVAKDVQTALREDVGSGDCTAELVHPDQQLSTRVICRQHAVLAGRPWFDETFAQLDPDVEITWQLGDGETLSPGQEVCHLEGHARSILTGERTALNFIQTLSSTATMARRYVEQVEGTDAVILDTRKTIPGLRVAQKYAVRCGGASNHRVGLYDAILIKENHIEALGSVSAAVKRAADLYPGLLLEKILPAIDRMSWMPSPAT